MPYEGHSPAAVLQKLMITHGLGSDVLENDLWPVFKSLEPEEYDDCLVVFNTVGKDFGRLQVTGEVIRHPGLQILVRSADSEKGAVKAREIERTLNEEVYRETVALYDDLDALYTYLVHSLNQTSQILYLGRDQEAGDRYLWTINFTIVLSLESVTESGTGTGT